METEKKTATLFQFTPLREGRQELELIGKIVNKFQFTPLREGRRAIPPEGTAIYCISIHAPPRGATEWKGSSVNDG